MNNPKNDGHTSEEISEKPLSPVLSSSKNTKVNLRRKKQCKATSRVKLSDRFSQNEPEESSNPKFDSFFLSQNESLWERIEEIETKGEPSNFSFKVPISPAPNAKKSKSPQRSSKGIKDVCFQTCSGKLIEVNTSDYDKHLKLFEDILNPSQDLDNKAKKFNFLKKSGILNTDTNLSVIELTDKQCNLKEATFTQEITDSGISNTQLLSAIDSVLCDDVTKKCEFFGFTKEELHCSRLYIKKFTNLYSSILSNKFGVANKTTYGKKRLKDEDIFVPAVKKLKFNKEDTCNDFNNQFNNFTGFSNASGKAIQISSGAIAKASELFANVEKEICSEEASNSHIQNFPSTSFAGGSKQFSEKFKNEEFSSLKVACCSKAALNESSEGRIFSCVVPTDLGGFSKASGKAISISADAINKANKIFDKIDTTNEENFGFATRAHRINDKTGDSALNVSEIAGNYQNNTIEASSGGRPSSSLFPTNLNGFSKASGKPISISADAINKANKVFDKTDDVDTTNEENFGLATRTHRKNDKICESVGNHKYNTIEKYVENKENTNYKGFLSASGSSIQNSISERNYFSRSLSDNTVVEFKTPGSSTKSGGKRKRSLGVTTCKQIAIAENKLSKAKLLFDDSPVKSPPKPKVVAPSNDIIRAKAIFADEDFSDIFGAGPSAVAIYNSTPIRSEIVCSAPDLSNVKKLSIEKMISQEEDSTSEITVIHTCGIIMRNPAKVNVDNWCKDLQLERDRLELALKNISERQNALEIFKVGCKDRSKRQPGALLIAKSSRKRMSLREFVKSKSPGANANLRKDYNIFNINPQNATLVHFIVKKVDKTADGAILLPNAHDLIGLSEIELAFNSMPGVDSKLIPKGWISNHYKWIVWKLASYERMFPAEFNGAFSLDHIIQQLKYRYDREIDKAQRSALRKIYEKDDTPQKRMVLCVSNITEDNGKYELELTDGWYGIKTVLDEPLSYQVFKGKVKIGSKLMTYGAEIYNCEGCYPLETTNMVYMRISYNCTRRAAWDTKLGYQACPGPFPIQIQSVHQCGGVVGSVKVYIARCYPQKFMERENSVIVWRNKKAEDRRAQEWDVERNKRIEAIHESVKKEYKEMECNKKTTKARYSKADIAEVTCPRSLLTIYENSIDPDSIQNLFSSAQKQILLEHQRSRAREKQDKMNARIREQIAKLNVSKRDVSSVWRLLILDANSILETPYAFNVWRPTSSHFQLLKEGTVVTLYNVLPGKSGELSSSFKTKFNPNPDHPTANFDKFKRIFVPIAALLVEPIEISFNEFDTVGIIIKIISQPTSQYLWLSDCRKRLLLIKIQEPAKNCILLDNVKRGQTVIVSNLTYRNDNSGVGQAIGGHCTIFSRFSQYRHLQEAVFEFEKDFPTNVEEFLDACDKKVSSFGSMTLQECSSSRSLEESTLEYSRVTSTDVAMSMIDIDKFLKY